MTMTLGFNTKSHEGVPSPLSHIQTQVKQPGAHPIYAVELEPHLLVQHSHDWHGDDEGIGIGIRASIPIIDNGPIRTINNSLAIGFGLESNAMAGAGADSGNTLRRTKFGIGGIETTVGAGFRCGAILAFVIGVPSVISCLKSATTTSRALNAIVSAVEA